MGFMLSDSCSKTKRWGFGRKLDRRNRVRIHSTNYNVPAGKRLHVLGDGRL